MAKSAPKKAAAPANRGRPKKQAAADPSAQPPREAAPMAAAKPSNGPTPTEKQQDLAIHQKLKRTLADIMQEAADVRGQIKSNLSAHKNKGGDPQMIVLMGKLHDMGLTEAEAAVARYFEYARDTGINIAFDGSGQGSLVDMLAEPARPTVEAAEALARGRSYNDGWNSAKSGGTVDDNPNQPGTESHQQWRKAFGDWHFENDVQGATEGAAAH